MKRLGSAVLVFAFAFASSVGCGSRAEPEQVEDSDSAEAAVWNLCYVPLECPGFIDLPPELGYSLCDFTCRKSNVYPDCSWTRCTLTQEDANAWAAQCGAEGGQPEVACY